MAWSLPPRVAAAAFSASVASLAHAGEVDNDRWVRVLTTAEVLEHATLDGVRVELDGNTDGAAFVFDDPARVAGEVTLNLVGLEGLDLASYDELHYDLRLGHGLVEPAVTLAGYPDDYSSRRWFFKRFPRVGEWDAVRLDLDLDDDRANRRSKQPERHLTLQFTRPAAQPDVPLEPPTATVRNLRLVRRPLSVTLDPRDVRTQREDGNYRFHHVVELTNHSDGALDVELRVIGETLNFAEASLSDRRLTLGPGETRTVTATLALPSAAVEPGHVERARLEIALPATGLVLEPIRGYRPLFLFAIRPPADPAAAIAPGDSLSPERIEQLEDALTRGLEIVEGIIPRYEDHFRCKSCGHRLRARDLYRYACVNGECEQRDQVIQVTKDDPLFASYLSIYHKKNASLTDDLSRAFVQTKDPRFAEAAERWLLDYADALDSLPLVSPHSTGFHSRLSSATLFEKESLIPFTDAYLRLRQAGLLDEVEAQRIADGLLVPLMYDVNLHHYGATAGQVNFILATLNAAMATGQWWFFADALGGDAGLGMLLGQGFDADGIGIEGGAYAKSAAERMIALGAFLDRIGVSADRERIGLIERNSRRIGLLGDPEWVTTVLHDTGFAALVNGAGDTKRHATINWRRSRERGEHDLLSYTFADPRGPLIHETGRIAYGNKHSKLMLRSAAHNTPVLDGFDIATAPLQLRAAGGDDSAAWCIIGSRAASPPYPGTHIERALVLVRGCLLVVDRIRTEGSPRTIDLPLYGSAAGGAASMTWDALPVSEVPIGPFAEEWRRSTAPVREATLAWRIDETPALRMHYRGDPVYLLSGPTVSGWTAQRRDVFVLRRTDASLDAACLYESLRTDSPRVSALTASETADGHAAVAIGFADGTWVDVVLSFEGAPVVAVRK